MDTLTGLLLLSAGVVVFSYSCDEAHYERCLTQLSKFSAKDNLLFASTAEELQTECVQAQSALGCLTRYSRKCLPLEERDKFTDRLSGSQKITMGLCAEESHLKKKYLEVLPCLRNASDGLEYCRQKYDRNQRDINIVEYEDKIHLRCCSFDGYLRCLRMVIELQTECGEGLSDVTQEIALRMGGDTADACAEHFERCTGDAPTTSSSVALLIISFISFGLTILISSL